MFFLQSVIYIALSFYIEHYADLMIWLSADGIVIKTFPVPNYLSSKDGVVWLFHLLLNLHIYSSLFHDATAQSLGPKCWRQKLWFECSVSYARSHSCRFDYQQRVMKSFPDIGYLCSRDSVVWLRHVVLHIYIYIIKW